MKPEITKESLIQEFLVFTFVSKSGLRKFIIKIETYMDKKPPDSELTLILSTLKTVKAEKNQQCFEECCAAAAPAFEALKSIKTRDYLHFYCMSMFITYLPAINESWAFFKEALKALESYDGEKYLQIRIAFHFNMTRRVLRTKYFEPSIDSATLDAKFSQCHDYAMAMCVQRKRPQQHALKVRKGIYENDMELVKDGLNTLLELDEKKRYKNVKADIVEYLKFMDESLTVDLLNTLQGHQIGKRRREMQLSVAQLADYADIEETSLHAIERGDAGISTLVLRNICKALSVSADYIIGNDNAKSEDEDLFMSRIKVRLANVPKEKKETFWQMFIAAAESLHLNDNEEVANG
ncbi:MAG: helix-turn-helix domain-containing protein [Defluviitaleaceae bacterium]|nr:helix-turn-helix domain-containing protein [Defluviitaleaceae bacterium]